MLVDKRTEEEKKAIIEENAAKLKVGDPVSHKTFGVGKITYVDTEKARVHISFEQVGDKKLTLLDIFKYVELIK